MQKSMVHELNSLVNSNIFTNRPSLGHIHHNDQEVSKLRSSRIQNLPGYRKEDLSGKLNFIIIFQTIQIERLSQQIETLRIKAKDWERQRLNYESYEVQIRQLTERCHLYELQREGIEQQLQKMKQFCENLYYQVEEYRKKYGQGEGGIMQKYKHECSRNQQLQIELQKWRNRYNSLDRARSKQLQQLRLQFQTKRQSMINKEIKEMTIKYQNNIGMISSDLKKARSQIQIKKSQLSRIQDLLYKMKARQNETKQIQGKMDQYQNRFVLLSQENYRLNELLRWKNEEIDRLRLSQQEFKTKFNSLNNLQEQNKNLKLQLDSNQAYTKDLERFVEKIKIQIEQLRAQNQKTEEYQKLIDQFQFQIERLNQLIHQKISQSDQLKTTNKLYETKLSSISQTTNKQFNNYQQQIVIYKKQQERSAIQNKQRLIQIQQCKEKITYLQKQIQKYRVLQQQNERLNKQIGVNVRKIEEFRSKIILLQQNLMIMQEIEKRLKQEEEAKRQMVNERQRLNKSIKSLTIQIQTISERANNDKAQLQRLQNVQITLNQFHSRLNWMTQELDRIYQEISIKTNQLNKIKQHVSTFSSNNDHSHNIQQRIIENLSQMEQLILTLDQSKRQNQRLENDKINLESHLKQLQSKIMEFNQQKEDLTRIVLEKTKVSQEYKKEILIYESKIVKFNEIHHQNEEQKKKIEVLTSTNTHVTSRLEYEMKKSNEYSSKIEQLSSQILQLNQKPQMSTKMGEQLQMIRHAIQQKNVVIYSQKKRLQTIQKMLSVLKQKYMNEQRICKILYQQYQSISSKVGLFDVIIDTSFKNYEEIEKLTQTSLQTINTINNKDIESLQMCESYRIINHKVHEDQMLGRIDQLNQSQFFDTGSNMDVYTFKDVRYQENDVSQKKEENIQIKNKQVDYSQVHSVDEARDTSSMASSFIDTLITKRSASRFQPNLVEYFDNLNSPGFAKNINQHRIIFRSPTNQQLFLQPQNHEQNNRYTTVQSQILNESNQINQIRMSPSNNQSEIYDNQGMKRVTSVTHFHQPYFRSQSFHNNHHNNNQVLVNNNSRNVIISPKNEHFVANNQQNSIQSRGPTPTIRILQVAESQNIANSTKNTTSQYGKPMRIPIDPTRLSSYQQS